MSNAAKQRSESQTESEGSVLAYAKQWYHVPVLVALMAFMLATRLRALSNFQTDGGVTFRGNDAWYHFRETSYLLDNFPSTMPFDPWTNYPAGTSAEQFGTLFDQIVAGFILLTSFGNPSGEYIGFVMLVAAPVFLILAVIPTYLIAARVAGRGPALAGRHRPCTPSGDGSQLQRSWLFRTTTRPKSSSRRSVSSASLLH